MREAVQLSFDIQFGVVLLDSDLHGSKFAFEISKGDCSIFELGDELCKSLCGGIKFFLESLQIVVDGVQAFPF